MLKNWFRNSIAKTRRQLRHSDAAKRLFARLEAAGSFVVNRLSLEELGVCRKHALWLIWDLAMAERLHVRAETDGQVIVMSNQAFSRLTQDRAGESNAVVLAQEKPLAVAAPRQLSAGDKVKSVVVHPVDIEMNEECAAATPVMIDVPLIHIHQEDEDTAVFSSALYGDEKDYEWFTIDVAPAIPSAKDSGKNQSSRKTEKITSSRQSLPERPRQPWVALENAKLDLD